MNRESRVRWIFLLFFVLAFGPVCGGGNSDDDERGSDAGADDDDDDDNDNDDNDDNDDDNDDNDDDDDNDNDNDASPSGFWTDSATGLTWKTDVPARRTWDDAALFCAALPDGDWRVPTISELRSLIRGCPASETGGPCGVSDDCLSGTCHNWYCNGCEAGGGPADGCYWPGELQGVCAWYWSSSKVAEYDRDVWGVFFGYGFINTYSMDDLFFTRCVRD